MVIHSFDIFDTCLFRSCGIPKNVFDLLGMDILKKDKIDEDVRYFSLIRSQGEIKARRKNTNKEVTLEEIYENCDFSNLTAVSKEDIKKQEMKIERDVLFANPLIKKEIESIHNKGEIVCFISDMYLSSEFLISVLKREGIYKNNDRLYVSCEVGETKRSGKLFDYVLKDLRLKPYCLQHKGDHFFSDFIIPLKKKIRASLYRRKLTYYEKMLCEINTSPEYDYNIINGLISQGIIQDQRNSHVIFAADFIAPIMVSFVYDILIDAKKRNIKKLYFLARDAFLPYCIAKEFSSLFLEIEIKYLYVSRRSLYYPSCPSFTKENKENIRSNLSDLKKSQTIDYLHLETIETKPDEFESFNNSYDIVSYLYESQKYIDIENRKNEQKKLIIEYFKQEGVADKENNVAIVDVRGTLRTQKAINDLLIAEGYPKVFGYYLEVQENRLLDFNKSQYNAILNRERYTHIKPFRDINKAADIIEQYFCITDQMRTKAYEKNEDGRVVPIFERNDFENYSEKKKIMDINNDICRQYINLYKTSGLLTSVS